MRAQLVPLDGGQPVDITKDITLVGRKEDCDLRLDHKSVSKLHCVLVKTDGLLLLRDLGSTNGTRVNGDRVRRAALLPNDQLTIANFGFRVFLGAGEPPASPTEGTVHLDSGEVEELKRQLGERGLADSGAELPQLGIPMRINALPDVYENDPKADRDE
jgi:pSer/pThr/pTyr-binding forkhead associated (FHA) protein